MGKYKNPKKEMAHVCPHCGCANQQRIKLDPVHGTLINDGDDIAYAGFKCGECGKEWVKVYYLEPEDVIILRPHETPMQAVYRYDKPTTHMIDDIPPQELSLADKLAAYEATKSRRPSKRDMR